jgi:hypothetical protein
MLLRRRELTDGEKNYYKILPLDNYTVFSVKIIKESAQ